MSGQGDERCPNCGGLLAEDVHQTVCLVNATAEIARLLARAESAEAALAALRAGVEGLADMYDNRIRDLATRLAPDAVAARLRALLAKGEES